MKLHSEKNKRLTKINHVRTCPSSQIEAHNGKKRGRLALDS